jgi:phospholipid transport system substrate-binding protein
MRSTAFFLFLIIVGAPSLTFGKQPLEALQQGIDKGIHVLEDPQYQDVARKKEQVQKLWEVTREIFDFKEFSRRVLASHWKKFSPRQREEFSELIGMLLGKVNLRKLHSRYNGEKVFYIDQKILNNSKALVEIKVLWKNLEVPVTLRMKKKHGKWKVYDINALGISALKNYRAQLHQILQTKSPAEVIDIFKEKIREKEEDV